MDRGEFLLIDAEKVGKYALNELQNLTSDEFSEGKDAEIRIKLAQAIAKAEGK